MFTAHRHIKSQAYTPVGTMSVRAKVCNLVRKWAAKVDHTQAQAHRSMAQEVTRQPLTDEQIKDACSGIFLGDHPSFDAYDRAVARAIERAHGITKPEEA